MVPDKPITQCTICGTSTGSTKAKYCDEHRAEARKQIDKNNQIVSDDELINALNKHGNIRRALIEVDIAPKGKNYVRAKRLIAEHSLPIKLGKGRPTKNSNPS